MFVLAGVCTVHVVAQKLPLAGFTVTRFPAADVKDSDINQQVEVNEYSLFINLPQKLKNDKTILVHGLQYRLTNPFSNNDTTLGFDGQDLHFVGYRLTALHKLKNDWKLLVVLMPLLSSSFSSPVDGNDFLFNGGVQFLKEKNKNFTYGGGFLVSTRFGRPLVLPAIQLTYTNERSDLVVQLPLLAAYEYKIWKNLGVGVQAGVNGAFYNVDYAVTDLNGLQTEVDRVSYSRVIAGPRVSYRFFDVFQLEASVGITAARNFELVSSATDDIDREAENNLYFRFGLVIYPSKQIIERQQAK